MGILYLQKFSTGVHFLSKIFAFCRLLYLLFILGILLPVIISLLLIGKMHGLYKFFSYSFSVYTEWTYVAYFVMLSVIL